MELAAYRRSAQTFLADLTRAYYRHYSGLDGEYAIEPIYERHAELFTRASVEELREELGRTDAAGEERRRLTMLVDFAADGFVGEAIKVVEAELARREAHAEIELDGRSVGFRTAAVLQANEPDPNRREEIEQARLAVTAELEPLHRELTERQHACASELGYASYADMCEDTKELALGALQAQTTAFTTASEERYPQLLEPQLQRVLGFGLGELRRSDLPRFFRVTDADIHYPTQQLVPSLLATLRDLGLDQRSGVILDVESRPNKSPRAFCAPVRIPQEVYLVIAPVGGRDDYSALFHEAGHSEHYAHVDPDLPFEFRYLGDNSITEAFAFLLQHLTDDPVWLERRLGVEDASERLAYARAHRLVYLRRYAAKLDYELELHDAGSELGETLAARYAELLGRALQVSWPTEPYLSDVDSGFYCVRYLRAWALETHLRAHLREQFGPAWFEVAEAGQLLRDLWASGQRLRPDELLAELGGGALDFRVLLDDLALAS